MAKEVIEQELRMKATEVVNSMQELEKVTKGYATQLRDVLDYLDKIEKKAPAVSNIVNNTKNINNANTYNQNITNKTNKFGRSKFKDEVVIGDTIYSYNAGSNTKSAKAAQQAAIEALQKENQLILEKINLEKELAKVQTAREKLLTKRAGTWEKDSETASRNSKANLLREQTRAAHPELFAAGALNRNWRYQGARALNAVGNKVMSMGTVGRIVGDTFNVGAAMLKAPAAGVTAIFSTLANSFVDLSKAATKAYTEIEAIKTQLGVVFSSQTQANSTFSEIAQYAVRSPFGVQQTSELAVLLKQSGVYASDLMDTLRMLGDTAGGNMEKMKRIANNYAQIVSIGKASMLDMRQFAYAGIPIFEAVSKELGVSQQELRKLISDGKVTSDIIEKVFKDLTGINGIFENATEIGAKTLKAKLQNLQDAKQLALSSIGEWGVNLGSLTGSDSNSSYVKDVVTWLEDIYTWLDKNIEKKNDEKKEDVFEQLENRIKVTKYLIDTAQNAEERSLFEKRLQALEREYDEEKVRANYVSAYDLKTREHNEFLKASGLDFYASETAQAALDNFVKKYGFEITAAKALEQRMNKDTFATSSLRYFRNQYLQENKYATTEQADEYLRAIYGEYQTLQNILDNAKLAETKNGREVDAAKQRDVQVEQNKLADNIDKMHKASGSMANVFTEIRQLQKEQKSYQEKEKELQKQRVEEGVKLLNELRGITDKNGILDFIGLSFDDYFKYLDTGAFSVEGKYNVFDSKKDAERLELEKYDVRNNLSKALSGIQEQLELRKSDNMYFSYEGSDKLEGLIDLLNTEEEKLKRLDVSDTSSFYNRITDIYDLLNKRILKVLENTETEEEKEFYTSLKNYLMGSTLKLGTTTTGYDFQFEEKEPKTTTEVQQNFIGLWRRLLGGAFGIPATVIKHPDNAEEYANQAFNLYQNDVAVRNRAGLMLEAGIRSGELSVYDLQKLMSPSVSRRKMEDGFVTQIWQIDWKGVNKNLKDFATQLNTSTSVLSAYKDSLQSEYDTYVKLLTSGMFSQETNGKYSQSTYLTEKQLKIAWTEESQYAVNAFGEKLMAVYEDGTEKEVAEFKNGKAIDSKGNEILAKTFYITGNIYEKLKERLKESKIELDKASINMLLGEGRDAIVDSRWFTYAMPRINATAEGREYIDQNQAYYKKLLQAEIESARTNLDSSLTVQQILDLWLQGIQSGQSVSEEADNIMNLAISRTSSNNPFAGGLRQLSERQRYNKYKQTFANIIGGETALDQNDWFAAFENKNLYGEALRLAGFDENVNFGKLAKDNGVDEITARQILAQEAIRNLKNETLSSLAEITKNGITDGFIAPFETLGESIIKLADGSWEAADAWDELSNKMRGITGSIISQTGDLMKNAGLALIQAGAMEHNKAYIWGGIGLAAAGGIAAGLGSALSNSQKDENKTQDEQKKLESLTDRIEELLKQARSDALYYEKNLRHRTALGINEKFSYTSVNDAVITPKGDVIHTSPDDYLFATKDPQSMGAVQPKINFTVIDNAGVRVETRQNVLPDGTVELQAILQSAMDEYIASERSDNAFAMRNYRINGRQSVM